jgi:poly-gamma-glutamate synthesis protein (capsule biosynthesis protein)
VAARIVILGRIVNEERQLSIFFSGDVMTGRGVDQILPRPGNPALHEDYVKDARDYVRLADRVGPSVPRPVDERYIWGKAFDVWAHRQPDLRIVNLETSITTSEDYSRGKGIHYRMHPDNVGCLTAASIDCCALANNHVLDWGRSGLEETLATLRAAGVATTGAGRNIVEARRPARLSVPGKADVLVFAAAHNSSGVPQTWRAGERRPGVHLLDKLDRDGADRLAGFISETRRPDDIVVLSIHWGSNWGFRIPAEQRRFAQRLVDAGVVDIVHGHSSHHPKAIEWYRGKVIFYGCGDFITDYEGIGGNELFHSWLSPMYFVTLDLAARQLRSIEIDVMRLRQFRLVEASGDDKRWLRNKLNESGAEFASFVDGDSGSLVSGPEEPQRGTAR